MTDTALSVPRPVSIAFAGVVVALLAGVAEALVHTAVALEKAEADVGGLAVGLAVRAAIYLAVLAAAVLMSRGSHPARLALTLGLGVVGLSSLLIEPVTAVLDGGIPWSAATPGALLIATLRAVHVAAVLVAVPAMWASGAHAHFAGRHATNFG